MITLVCEKCGQCYRAGDQFSGKTIRCEKCGCMNQAPAVHVLDADMNYGIPYADDGLTPDFNALFAELLKQEREAPTLELAHR